MNTFARYCIALLTLLLAAPDYARASAAVTITEIGAHEAAGAEWIEIYNAAELPVDITGWKFFEDGVNHKLSSVRGGMALPAGAYAVIAQDGTAFAAARPEVSYVIDSSWSSLRLDGELIGLTDAPGAAVERFTYSPVVNRSLQRREPFIDPATDAWADHPTGDSAGMPNVFFTGETPGEPQSATDIPDSPAAAPAITAGGPLPQRGTVIINEIVSDPTSGNEWVELRNLNAFPVDLAGWTLTEGAGGTTILTGSIDGYGYRAFDNLKGALNNGGDIVILKDATENTLDTVAYGTWDDGFTDDNPPAAADPCSIARDPDALVWQLTTSVTKNAPNVIQIPAVKTPAPSSAAEKKAAAPVPIISELFPNPPGDDTAYEFIELRNPANDYIDIAGWQLVDSEKQSYIFPENTVLRPGDYRAFDRIDTRIALDNDGDSVTLYDRNEKKIDKMAYTGGVPESASVIRTDAGVALTAQPTRGAANIALELPAAPVIRGSCAAEGGTIVCDASDSYDENKDVLSFTWRAEESVYTGARMVHIVLRGGKIQVALSLSDGVHTVQKNFSVSVSGVATADTASPESTVSAPTEEIDPLSVELADIDALSAGALVTVTGVASKVTTASVYLTDDTETVRAQYPKSGPVPVKGLRYEVTGEIKLRAGKPYIAVLSPEGIRVVADIPEQTIPDVVAPRDGGGTAAPPAPIEIPSRTSSGTVMLYLSIAAAASGAAWWLTRKYPSPRPAPIRAHLYDTS